MICSDVPSCVQVVVENLATGAGVEMLGMIPIGLRRDSAPTALLTGIAGVDGFHGDSRLLGFGFQDLTKLGETPIGILPVPLTPLILLDFLEVFNDDGANVFAVTQDGLHRTVEDVIPEAVLTPPEAFQTPAARRCALGLEFSTAKSHLRCAMVEMPASDEFSTGGHGDVSNALIDADRPAGFTNGWRILGDADVQEPISTLSLDESGTTDLPRAVEELEMVWGELDVDVDPVFQTGKRNMICCDLGGPDVKCHGGLGELRLGLRPSFSTGPSPSRLKGTTNDLEGGADVVGFEIRKSLPDITITEVVDAIGGELLRTPSDFHDLIHHTDELPPEFFELIGMFVAEFDGYRSFHIIYDIRCECRIDLHWRKIFSGGAQPPRLKPWVLAQSI